MRITFPEVALRSTKSGRCACGKRRQRSEKFFQTINPFNVNALGKPKSAAEITEELKQERDTWRQEPITCDQCKSKSAAH
jgi:hypothetical protein